MAPIPSTFFLVSLHIANPIDTWSPLPPLLDIRLLSWLAMTTHTICCHILQQEDQPQDLHWKHSTYPTSQQMHYGVFLNGMNILVCNVLHVPVLCSSLYSLHYHLMQRGCNFLSNQSLLGFFFQFPFFILSVYMCTNYHLSCKHVGYRAFL